MDRLDIAEELLRGGAGIQSLYLSTLFNYLKDPNKSPTATIKPTKESNQQQWGKAEIVAENESPLHKACQKNSNFINIGSVSNFCRSSNGEATDTARC